MKIKNPRPSASKLTVLRQLCNLIPSHLVPKLARETGVDKVCRTFSAWSHVVAMLYAQLTHSIGLNDVCDALRLHSGPLSAIRGATPPSRNGLSHAGKERKAELAKKLFWAMLGHLQSLCPGFAHGNRGRGVTRRFRRTIHIVDFDHLFDLFLRGVFWVTRTKTSHCFKVVKRRTIRDPKILADEEVLLSAKGAFEGKYPERMHRIRALIEVDGVEREMEPWARATWAEAQLLDSAPVRRMPRQELPPQSRCSASFPPIPHALREFDRPVRTTLRELPLHCLPTKSRQTTPRHLPPEDRPLILTLSSEIRSWTFYTASDRL